MRHQSGLAVAGLLFGISLALWGILIAAAELVAYELAQLG